MASQFEIHNKIQMFEMLENQIPHLFIEIANVNFPSEVDGRILTQTSLGIEEFIWGAQLD